MSRYGAKQKLRYVSSAMLLGWLLTAAAPDPALADTVQVMTRQGPVVGVEHDGWSEFRGIPFAQAPIGDLRWAPPEPRAAWKAPLAAAEYGPACLQTQTGETLLDTSEDCLNLNVWTPAADDETRPVLVWIHGGGLRVGSNRVAGEVFAERGLVVVSINYRLGPLGFFAHDALDEAVANPALLDMVLALQWVQDNIRAFGGDPQRVTIFGVSAGAMAVNLLMTSAAAEGLFHGAMAFSGYATWALPHRRSVAADPPLAMDLTPVPRAEDLAAALVNRVNPDAVTTEQLRQLDGQRLVDALQGFQLPIVDGTSLPAEPAVLFRSGEAHAVPYLTGGNSYEGSVMPASGISLDHYAEILGSRLDKTRSLYAEDFALGREVGLSRAFGDHRYLLSARVLGTARGRLDQPTWLYYVDYVPASQSDTWLGTPHGVDAYLLFAGHASEEAQTRALMERMRAYWSNFARHGDPNGPGLTPWPQYRAENDPWLVIGAEDQTRSGLLADKLTLLEAHYLERIGAAPAGSANP